MVRSGRQVTQSNKSPTTPKRPARTKVNGADTAESTAALTPGSTSRRKGSQNKHSEVSPDGKTGTIATPGTSGRKRKAAEIDKGDLDTKSPTKSRRKKLEEDSTPEQPGSKVIKEEEAEEAVVTPKKGKKKKVGNSEEAKEGAKGTETTPKDRKAHASRNKEEKKEDVEDEEAKPHRKRKTKGEKEAEAMPLAARTTGLRMFFGAHVSCAKGVQNGVLNSVHIGGNAFAMFLKSQRKWDNPPLQDEHRDQFKAFCTEHGYDAASHILPHGSYLVNLANPEPEAAAKAYAGFIDDIHRCEALGIKYYNFHPGTTGSHPRSEAIARIAAALNKVHAESRTVVPLLETMATAGSNVIGSAFEDLRDVIALIGDKSRIGVCLDTCHVFAAGYDLRTPDAFKKTLERFDEVIGMRYLKALHLNDSKAPLAAGRDLHQNIGLGFLGLKAFHNVVNEERFENLPMVLETPIDSKDENGKEIENRGVWATEIKMLEEMIGMDTESERFRQLEKELAAKGAEERAKYQDAFVRKKAKAEKGQTKLSFAKGKKTKKMADGDSGSEQD